MVTDDVRLKEDSLERQLLVLEIFLSIAGVKTIPRS
jgi:hypothetical protein